MKQISFILGTVFIGGVLALSAAAPALAQNYPSKPIKIIVPYPAGGSTDQIARLISVPMSKSMGQPVVVENISGGNTMIGASTAARAAPDGYTLMVNSLAYSVNLLVTKSPSYKAEDFIPVAGLMSNPYVLSVNQTVPATSLKELIDYAKREPSKVNAASLGVGGVTHLLNERFAAMVGVPLTSVQYRGAAPALVDLMSGQVQFFIDNVVTSIPHIRADKLRPLAVSSTERSPLMPNVPTFRELGYPRMTQDAWFGLFAPKGTPQGIVERLNAEAQKALAAPEVQAVLIRDGMKTPTYSPVQFSEFIKQDAASWRETVKSLNIQLD
ncbi:MULTISPECIES: Bug family tripartite tricarboxylate transporter substrate binding protein [Polaromonas]|uniref:Bug family tripartite tricarboxylate transporter substrate binding protein n=1 Tax=Polaromonas aquatica TaxID=332657 RepID=A0ABW1U5E8_9BURK